MKGNDTVEIRGKEKKCITPPDNILDLISDEGLRTRAEEIITETGIDIKPEFRSCCTTKMYSSGKPYGTEAVFINVGLPVFVYIQKGGKSFSISIGARKMSLVLIGADIHEAMYIKGEYYSHIDLDILK